jgi:hypothetical protein
MSGTQFYLGHSSECDCGSDSPTDTSLDLGIFSDVFFVRERVTNLEGLPF